MNPLRPVSTSKEYHASNGNAHDDHGSDPYSFGEERGGGSFVRLQVMLTAQHSGTRHVRTTYTVEVVQERATS